MLRSLRGCGLFALLATCLAVATVPAGAQDAVCTTDISGCWSGSWCSNTNGHHGPIKASVCMQDGCTYCVHFRGRYLKLVPFSYTIPMTVTGRTADGRITLYGASHLPLFGQFCCTAESNGCQFVASYSSCKDQGTFTMCRCN